MTPKQIKSKVPEVDGAYISRTARKLGIPKFKSGFEPSANSIKAEQMLVSGFSPREIKEKLPSVESSTISILTKKLGLPAWRRGAYPGPRPETQALAIRARKMLDAGEKKAHIARSLRICQQLVHQILEPNKEMARRALKWAVKCGKLIRPKVCQKCLRGDRKIHAHHEDYDKPLDVLWVCPPCHGKLFKKT